MPRWGKWWKWGANVLFPFGGLQILVHPTVFCLATQLTGAAGGESVC